LFPSILIHAFNCDLVSPHTTTPSKPALLTLRTTQIVIIVFLAQMSKRLNVLARRQLREKAIRHQIREKAIWRQQTSRPHPANGLPNRLWLRLQTLAPPLSEEYGCCPVSS
jgi:hypothetical protein